MAPIDLPDQAELLERLFESCLDRDRLASERAWHDLVKLIYPDVSRLARAYTRNFAITSCTADDVMNDALCSLYANLKSITNPKGLVAWLNAVMRNRCIDLSRRHSHKRETVGFEPWLERAYDGTDPGVNRMALTAAINSIALERREVLYMHYWLDMSVEDIANKLKRPESTIKSRLKRGRDELRNCDELRALARFV